MKIKFSVNHPQNREDKERKRRSNNWVHRNGERRNEGRETRVTQLLQEKEDTLLCVCLFVSLSLPKEKNEKQNALRESLLRVRPVVFSKAKRTANPIDVVLQATSASSPKHCISLLMKAA